MSLHPLAPEMLPIELSLGAAAAYGGVVLQHHGQGGLAVAAWVVAGLIAFALVSTAWMDRAYRSPGELGWAFLGSLPAGGWLGATFCGALWYLDQGNRTGAGTVLGLGIVVAPFALLLVVGAWESWRTRRR